MNSEVESIKEVLCNSGAEWQEKESALIKLTAILSTAPSELAELGLKLLESPYGNKIAVQFGDLRSGLVKVAKEVVLAATDIEGPPKRELLKFTEIFLNEPTVLKAVGSANKVIANHSASAFNALFEKKAVSFDSILSILATARNTKNSQIRERVIQGLSIFTEGFQKDSRTLTSEQVNTLLQTTDYFVRDAAPGVRNFARKTKITLSSLETNSRKIRLSETFSTFDETTKDNLFNIKNTPKIVKRTNMIEEALTNSTNLTLDQQKGEFFAINETFPKKEEKLARPNIKNYIKDNKINNIHKEKIDVLPLESNENSIPKKTPNISLQEDHNYENAKMILSLVKTDLRQDNLSIICSKINTLSEQFLSSGYREGTRILMNAVLQLSIRCTKEQKTQVAELALCIGDEFDLLNQQIEIFEEIKLDYQLIVSSLKFLIVLFNIGSNKKEALARIVSPLAKELKRSLFSHQEVMIRKTVVQLLVTIFHIVGQEKFEEVLQFFNSDQQKLIQVFVKKSLE